MWHRFSNVYIYRETSLKIGIATLIRLEENHNGAVVLG